ncbi:MAG: TPM domain-containing protein [Bacteroidales bacterium]
MRSRLVNRAHAAGNKTFALAGRKLSVACLLLMFIFISSTVLSAQVPARPSPPKLVNDLAGIFSSEDVIYLEKKLVDFANKTSNQIAVVTLKSLEGMDKSQMAYSIGEQWKVGQEKFDNGVVILIKPKVGSERGEVFIATGYGLEGALPDAICKRIVENEMIPEFRSDNYLGGVDKALAVIMPIAAGEISSAEYAKKTAGSGAFGSIGLIIFIIVIFILMVSKKGGSSNIGGGGKKGPSALELLLLGSLLTGGRGHSGGFGGGGFGGGGGGFGGFGGGGFGGGGAGGSW